ncbi:MAG: glutathione S-transferase family protein [Blastomonas sp.]
MTDRIKFYTNPMSRGQIARWALEESGAPYDQILLEYGTSMKDADYLAINPMGKVPAIVDKGHVVTECAAICAYLADAFPDAGLAPHADERADYYRWLFFAAGPIEAAVTSRALGWTFDNPQREMMAGFGNFDRPLEVLAGVLAARDYICGARFTMADVYVGSQVDWGLQFGTFPDRKEFQDYAARIRQREAYQRSKAIDGALIAEAEAAKAASEAGEG